MNNFYSASFLYFLLYSKVKVMKKYRIKITKKYIFDLDDKSNKNIFDQVNFVLYETEILDMPYVKKT